MTIIFYLLLSVCNACVWSAFALIVGMPANRTPLCWLLVCALSFFVLAVIGGARIAEERAAYYRGEE